MVAAARARVVSMYFIVLVFTDVNREDRAD